MQFRSLVGGNCQLSSYHSNILWNRYNEAEHIDVAELSMSDESDVEENEDGEARQKALEVAQSELTPSLRNLLDPIGIHQEWEEREIQRSAHVKASTLKVSGASAIASKILGQIEVDSDLAERIAVEERTEDGRVAWTDATASTIFGRMAELSAFVPAAGVEANVLDTLSVVLHVQQCKALIHLSQWLASLGPDLCRVLAGAWMKDSNNCITAYPAFGGLLTHVDQLVGSQQSDDYQEWCSVKEPGVRKSKSKKKKDAPTQPSLEALAARELAQSQQVCLQFRYLN